MRKNGIGIIVFNYDYLDVVKSILDEKLDNDWLISSRRPISLGRYSRLDASGRKYGVYIVYGDVFQSYNYFDSYLLRLGEIFNDMDNLGLLIGNIDSDGFLWADYVFHTDYKYKYFKEGLEE